MKEENISSAALQEYYFLQTFPLIHRIVSHKLKDFNQDATEDVVQKVALKLWTWKLHHEQQYLSAEEWQKLANSATQNEIKNFYSSKLQREIPLWEENEGYAPIQENNLLGNTPSELRSLLIQLWKAIQLLSLRQKYTLLLRNESFIIDLIGNDVSSIMEIADSLYLTRDELKIIIKSLPLSDNEIKDLLETKLQETITLKQVWSARDKAKIKLASILKDFKNANDRTSFKERT